MKRVLPYQTTIHGKIQKAHIEKISLIKQL